MSGDTQGRHRSVEEEPLHRDHHHRNYGAAGSGEPPVDLAPDTFYQSLVRFVGGFRGTVGAYMPFCQACCPLYYHRVSEGECAIVTDFGRYAGTMGAGLHAVVPYAQQMTRVSLADRLLDMPRQAVFTRDNLSVSVDGLLYYKVVDARAAVFRVNNVVECVDKLAKTALRDAFTGVTLQ